MIERERIPAPAQTYDLNIVASVLGRYAVPNLDARSSAELSDVLLDTIDSIRGGEKPEVPHTSPELLAEAIAFDEKLLMQLSHGPASDHLSVSEQRSLGALLSRHLDTTERMLSGGAKVEMLTSPSDIADAYGLSDMWANSSRVIQEEAESWKKYKEHPPIPFDLSLPVSLDDTKKLLALMWKHVVEESESPEVNVYLTETPQYYHVFWAALSDRLDYATPRQYDRATQLSFDLPHNATHLAHLAAIGPTRSQRYDDNMAQRAYFEAATVFSEYKTIQIAESDKEFGQSLAAILHAQMNVNELADWVVKDRGYEFKLRAARYMADVAMINGVRLEDAVNDIAKTLDIPVDDAKKELVKYLPWTGLGAAYTFGYRKLVDKGVVSVQQVLKDPNGSPITSWAQQDQIDWVQSS